MTPLLTVRDLVDILRESFPPTATGWDGEHTTPTGETVRDWEPSNRVKLVYTTRPDGSTSYTVHVEPVRTGWDAEGVPIV